MGGCHVAAGLPVVLDAPELVSALPFLFAAAASIFVTVDPIGVLPFFVALTEDFDEKDRDVIMRRAVLTTFAILTIFLFTGRWLFQAFGFTLYAVEISGGILLFYTAFEMLNGDVGKKIPAADREEALRHRDEIAVAPLGIPLLAGPGAIATVMVYEGNSGGDPLDLFGILLAILGVAALTWVILAYGPRIFRFLGRSGITAIIRIMGLLLGAVAVQFVINGALGVLRSVPP